MTLIVFLMNSTGPKKMTTKDFKYYEVTATSMEVLKCWIRVPASKDEDEVWEKAREIDGGNFLSCSQDWQLDDVVQIDEDSEKMYDEPIEYTTEDFKNA